MTDDAPTIDHDKAALLAFQVWTYKQGEVVSLMIHLGDRLGLYRAMVGAGPLTAEQLAERTGLHERWLLEWLRSQGAAGLLATTDGVVFELTPEGAAVLADEEGSLFFAAGAFHGNVVGPDVLDRLADAFRTGQGLTYDDLGPSAAHQVERMLGPWTRQALVPDILPRIDGLVDRLRAGAKVADVGCGAGIAAVVLAEAFPASSFEGFDPSQHAIHRARTKVADEGIANATFHVAEAEDLPEEPTFDLVLTFDCLHDMAHPTKAVAAIRRSLRPDGVWLIKEIRAGSTWEDNLRNPVLAMMYGTSVATCMSSALSEPGGEGLGTLGLPADRLERLVRDAGFTTFVAHDVGDPANLYYEVRP